MKSVKTKVFIRRYGRPMSRLAPLFTSMKGCWETPCWLIEAVEAVVGPIDLDVASTHQNCVSVNHITEVDDALTVDWVARVDTHRMIPICKERIIWCNPPYGRQIGKWVEKCFLESQRGATVLCLIPARTDTKYWHNWAFKAEEWWVIKGRLKFCLEGCEVGSAPFPSVVLVFTERGDSGNPRVSPLKEE